LLFKLKFINQIGSCPSSYRPSWWGPNLCRLSFLRRRFLDIVLCVFMVRHLLSCWFLAQLILRPWRRKWYIPRKHQLIFNIYIKLHPRWYQFSSPTLLNNTVKHIIVEVFVMITMWNFKFWHRWLWRCVVRHTVVKILELHQ
jgi:hypothetical protein